jgi:hypothetical protein
MDSGHLAGEVRPQRIATSASEPAFQRRRLWSHYLRRQGSDGGTANLDWSVGLRVDHYG